MGNSVAALVNNKPKNKTRREETLFVRFGEEKYIINHLNQLYNGKFILKCNLILLACVIICLIFMSMTDGLSAVIAGVFGVWLLVFVIIGFAFSMLAPSILEKLT